MPSIRFAYDGARQWMPQRMPASLHAARMRPTAATTAGSSGSSFGVCPIERARSLGPTYTPVSPGVPAIASTFSSASAVSTIASVTTVSFALAT